MTTADEAAKKRTRAEVASRLYLVFVGTVAVAALALISVGVYRSGQTTQAIRSTQQNNHILLSTIQDCTQPSGGCYRRGQEQTASAVSSINRVVVLAAACSVGLSPDLSVPQRQSAIQNCVIDRLARHNKP